MSTKPHSKSIFSDKFQKDTSPAKGLFLGNIHEENLFPFPSIKPEEKETLSMIVDSIDKFMAGQGEKYRKFDREGYQPDDYINTLKELGLFGLIIGEDFGGIGLSNAGYSRVLQQSSRYDASTSLTVGAHSSIGMKGLLLFGTPQQKAKYLPKLASGELIASFCLTEPGSGSDAGSIKTTAAKNKDGTWTLNGEKIWITNGAFAGLFTVFAKTAGEDGKMSAFIVERAFPGVTSGPKEDKLGIRASATTAIRFENVQVPAENLLGEEGKGFKVAMSILNSGRTGLGGGCVGAMKECIALACKQSLERKQFGRPVAEFALVQDKIAQMSVNCFAAESVVQMVASLIDAGNEDYSVEAAISKVFATEAAWQAANEALQIAGGNGYMKDFPYERIVRDCRINMIFEGTNEILRLYIALSGLKVAGENLKEIGKSASKIFNDPIKGFGVLSGYAAKRLSQLTPFGRDKISDIDESVRAAADVFEKYTARFGGAVQALLKRYGKNIVGTQLQSKRVAEIAIDLFVGLSTVSRVNTLIKMSSPEKCSKELQMLNLFTTQAKRRMHINFRRIEKNEDETTLDLAKHILADGYKWDVLN